MGVSAAHSHKGFNGSAADGTPKVDFYDLLSIGGVTNTGKIVFVDSVFGNDVTGLRQRNDKPFATIAAAIAAALSGDTVYILPGTYSLSAGITIPDGVAMRGINTLAVTIQMLLVTADTTLVTMGENTRLEDVTLKLTSAEHHTLKGISFPGTTSATAKWRTAVITVDNSGAGAGSSEVYGVHSSGTGTPHASVSAIRACTITVSSTGSGKKRGILVNTAAHNFHLRDVNIRVTGGTDSIGEEVDFVGAVLRNEVGNVSGDTADISQTSGALQIGSTNLEHGTANGKYFHTLAVSPIIDWGEDGSTSAGTRYMRFGSGSSTANEISLSFTRRTVVKGLRVRAVVSPSGGRTDTFTVRKNGVNTAVQVMLSSGTPEAEDVADSVTFEAGDDLSLQIVGAGGGVGASDVKAQVDTY